MFRTPADPISRLGPANTLSATEGAARSGGDFSLEYAWAKATAHRLRVKEELAPYISIAAAQATQVSQDAIRKASLASSEDFGGLMGSLDSVPRDLTAASAPPDEEDLRLEQVQQPSPMNARPAKALSQSLRTRSTPHLQVPPKLRLRQSMLGDGVGHAPAEAHGPFTNSNQPSTTTTARPQSSISDSRWGALKSVLASADSLRARDRQALGAGSNAILFGKVHRQVRAAAGQGRWRSDISSNGADVHTASTQLKPPVRVVKYGERGQLGGRGSAQGADSHVMKAESTAQDGKQVGTRPSGEREMHPRLHVLVQHGQWHNPLDARSFRPVPPTPTADDDNHGDSKVETAQAPTRSLNAGDGPRAALEANRGDTPSNTAALSHGGTPSNTAAPDDGGTPSNTAAPEADHGPGGTLGGHEGVETGDDGRLDRGTTSTVDVDPTLLQSSELREYSTSADPRPLSMTLVAPLTLDGEGADASAMFPSWASQPRHDTPAGSVDTTFFAKQHPSPGAQSAISHQAMATATATAARFDEPDRVHSGPMREGRNGSGVQTAATHNEGHQHHPERKLADALSRHKFTALSGADKCKRDSKRAWAGLHLRASVPTSARITANQAAATATQPASLPRGTTVVRMQHVERTLRRAANVTQRPGGATAAATSSGSRRAGKGGIVAGSKARERAVQEAVRLKMLPPNLRYAESDDEDNTGSTLAPDNLTARHAPPEADTGLPPAPATDARDMVALQAGEGDATVEAATPIDGDKEVDVDNTQAEADSAEAKGGTGHEETEVAPPRVIVKDSPEPVEAGVHESITQASDGPEADQSLAGTSGGDDNTADEQDDAADTSGGTDDDHTSGNGSSYPMSVEPQSAPTSEQATTQSDVEPLRRLPSGDSMATISSKSLLQTASHLTPAMSDSQSGAKEEIERPLSVAYRSGSRLSHLQSIVPAVQTSRPSTQPGRSSPPASVDSSLRRSNTDPELDPNEAVELAVLISPAVTGRQSPSRVTPIGLGNTVYDRDSPAMHAVRDRAGSNAHSGHSPGRSFARFRHSLTRDMAQASTASACAQPQATASSSQLPLPTAWSSLLLPALPPLPVRSGPSSSHSQGRASDHHAASAADSESEGVVSGDASGSGGARPSSATGTVLNPATHSIWRSHSRVGAPSAKAGAGGWKGVPQYTDRFPISVPRPLEVHAAGGPRQSNASPTWSHGAHGKQHSRSMASMAQRRSIKDSLLHQGGHEASAPALSTTMTRQTIEPQSQGVPAALRESLARGGLPRLEASAGIAIQRFLTEALPDMQPKLTTTAPSPPAALARGSSKVGRGTIKASASQPASSLIDFSNSSMQPAGAEQTFKGDSMASTVAESTLSSTAGEPETRGLDEEDSRLRRGLLALGFIAQNMQGPIRKELLSILNVLKVACLSQYMCPPLPSEQALFDLNNSAPEFSKRVSKHTRTQATANETAASTRVVVPVPIRTALAKLRRARHVWKVQEAEMEHLLGKLCEETDRVERASRQCKVDAEPRRIAIQALKREIEDISYRIDVWKDATDAKQAQASNLQTSLLKYQRRQRELDKGSRQRDRKVEDAISALELQVDDMQVVSRQTKALEQRAAQLRELLADRKRALAKARTKGSNSRVRQLQGVSYMTGSLRTMPLQHAVQNDGKGHVDEDSSRNGSGSGSGSSGSGSRKPRHLRRHESV